MIAVLLLMIVAGIGLAQAVSDPYAVSLRWLRLGGIIAVTLGAVAMTATIITGVQDRRLPAARVFDGALIVFIVLLPFIVQLVTVQLGQRKVQRIAAGAGYLLLGGVAWGALAAMRHVDASSLPPTDWKLLAPAYLTSGLLGGCLMAMLLGHAYLTAGGEMTQAPFRRLVIMLGILLALRAATSLVFGLVPYLARPPQGANLWPLVMITARYAVGLFVTGIFTWMAYDCVKRRANQSATGILYVTTVLIFIGEWSALSLYESTGLVF